MRRLWIALRAFFVALFDGPTARQIDDVLARRRLGSTAAEPSSSSAPAPEVKKRPEPKPLVRSEALALVAMLQREARFVDFLKEPLGEYSDAQVGAAARDVHRDCGAALERAFGIVPALRDPDGQPPPEGETVEAPVGYDPGRYRITGNVTGEPPYRGRLVHPGWEATRCDLPAWSGKESSLRIVAPVEVELA